MGIVENVCKGAWRVLRSLVSAPFKLFFTRGVARVRLIILAIFILAILAAGYDWPVYINKSIDWGNRQLETQEKVERLRQVKLPHFEEALLRTFYSLKLHKLGIFPRQDFRLGLDLAGGTHLVYEADFSGIEVEDKSQSMQGLRDVIERRVNIFGVAEPLVQVDESGGHHRLIVEIAGIDDPAQAVDMIGSAPFLEFRDQAPDSYEKPLQELALTDFQQTELRGGEYLNKAELAFDQTTGESMVSLEFNDKGAEIFFELTKKNVDKILAIFIDGYPISLPRVKEPISGGKAVISGSFTTEEAKALARNINAGAISVPINLVSQQSVGAYLGGISLEQSLKAAYIGVILVILFMILFYRLPGILAVIALSIYISFILAIFKLFSITLTLSGIAGFIMSIGMAVDANVLTFERMKEERKEIEGLALVIERGFGRAWTSIWDSNVTTLIGAVILFWLGTGFVQGFALTLGIGVVVSMFSAVFVTRNLLRLFIGTRFEKFSFLWRTGTERG